MHVGMSKPAQTAKHGFRFEPNTHRGPSKPQTKRRSRSLFRFRRSRRRSRASVAAFWSRGPLTKKSPATVKLAFPGMGRGGMCCIIYHQKKHHMQNGLIPGFFQLFKRLGLGPSPFWAMKECPMKGGDVLRGTIGSPVQVGRHQVWVLEKLDADIYY